MSYQILGSGFFFPNRLVWLLVGMWLALSSESRGQELRLSAMNQESFADWLVGTKWQGDGATLHYVTKRLMWVTEKSGEWSCGYRVPGLGKIEYKYKGNYNAKWKGATISEDLKTRTISGGKKTLVGRGKLDGLGTGKLVQGDSAQFDRWLQSKQLVSDSGDVVIRFRDGNMWGLYRQLYGDTPALYQVIEPGLVEFSYLKSHSLIHYLQISPDLETFRLVWNKGVIKGKVQTLTAETEPTARVIKEYLGEKEHSRLSLMTKEDFAKWLVGTRWIKEAECMTFITPRAVHLDRQDGADYSYGYEIVKPGLIRIPWRGDRNSPDTLLVAEDLKSATWRHHGGRKSRRLYVGRYLPPSLGKGRLAEMSNSDFDRWLREHRLWVYEKVDMTFLENGFVTGLHNNKPTQVSYEVIVPGLVELNWVENPFSRPIIVVDSDLSSFYYGSKWNGTRGTVKPLSSSSDSPTEIQTITPGFDLSQLKSVPIKLRLAKVNSLVLSSLGNSRYAAGASKLSLTAVELKNDDPATMGFNQPVGKLMSSALKEVLRFHAIRNGGWPRGAQVELAFAEQYSDKDGPSAAVACALLIESMLTGTKLNPDFAVTGDLNADGTVQPVGGVQAKIRGAARSKLEVVGIPLSNREDLLDLLVIDGPDPLLKTQVFSLESFDDALQVGRANPPSEVRSAINDFRKVSRWGLKTPEAKSALQMVVQSAPNHLSARLLLSYLNGAVPQRLTLRGSLSEIDQSVAAVIEATKSDLTATSNLDAGKISLVISDLNRLRAKIDPRIRPYCDAWINWARVVNGILGGRVTTKKDVAQLKAAGRKIDAERDALRKNESIQDELL